MQRHRPLQRSPSTASRCAAAAAPDGVCAGPASGSHLEHLIHGCWAAEALEPGRARGDLISRSPCRSLNGLARWLLASIGNDCAFRPFQLHGRRPLAQQELRASAAAAPVGTQGARRKGGDVLKAVPAGEGAVESGRDRAPSRDACVRGSAELPGCRRWRVGAVGNSWAAFQAARKQAQMTGNDCSFAVRMIVEAATPSCGC